MRVTELNTDLVRNFVNRSIIFRHLTSNIKSSSNSLYAYHLLLILLEEEELENQDKIKFQDELLKTLINYTIYLLYQSVTLIHILNNLEYAFRIIAKNDTPDLGLVLQIIDLRFRCLLGQDSNNLDLELSMLEDFINRKHNKNYEELLGEIGPDVNTPTYLLLLRIGMLTKLVNKSSFDFKLVSALKDLELNNITFFFLYDVYVIALLLIENENDLVALLVQLQILCEDRSYNDTAFFLAIVLHRLTKEKEYISKISKLEKYRFRFRETREYLDDDRDPQIFLKEFLWKTLIYHRAYLENLFEYKLFSESVDLEFGVSNFELSPNDIDYVAIQDRNNL